MTYKETDDQRRGSSDVASWSMVRKSMHIRRTKIKPLTTVYRVYDFANMAVAFIHVCYWYIEVFLIFYLSGGRGHRSSNTFRNLTSSDVRRKYMKLACYASQMMLQKLIRSMC